MANWETRDLLIIGRNTHFTDSEHLKASKSF